MAAISGLFRRASSYLGYDSSPSAASRPAPLDGEIIFSKNNVCVHPTATLRVKAQHNPGSVQIAETRNGTGAGGGGRVEGVVAGSRAL